MPSSKVEQYLQLIDKVKDLIAQHNGEPKTLFLQEMLVGVLKFYDTPLDVLDVKILNRAIKELRYAFQVFHPYRHCPKVSILGQLERPQKTLIFN